MNDLPQEEPRAGASLIVLTLDDSLVETLKAVCPQHALSILGTEADLPSHLLGDHGGVAIIDAAAVGTPIDALTERLSTQFPDLVLIVAGDSHAQHDLTAQVTRGTVYRFLHKPVSAQRVKLFVEAAIRRHDEEQAPQPATRHRSVASEPLLSRNTLLIGAAVVVMAVAAALYVEMKPTEPVAAAKTGSTPQSAPAVQASGSATNQIAQARNDEIERLLTSAEQALLAEKVDDAARFVESAKQIEPENVRVVFLTAQIARERERAALTQARNAVAGGNINKALQVLDGTARNGERSPLVAETRQELQQLQVDARVESLLNLAAERLRTGFVLEPAQDNARFYIESAVAIAPDNESVLRAEREFARNLVTRARAALSGGNTDEGERWIGAASDAGASVEEVSLLRRDVQNARVTAKAEAMTRLSRGFDQRLTQNRLVEPANDSAAFYLRQLEQTDPTHPSTRQARLSLSTKLVDEARNAASRGDLATADALVEDARSLNIAPASIAAIEREIAAVRATPGTAAAAEVISAGRLERTKYVPPEYPGMAQQRKITGAVDLEFTVRKDGRVVDIAIAAADPPKVFDQAAISAVRQWRYRPMERNGSPVDQRVRLKMRFAMDE